LAERKGKEMNNSSIGIIIILGFALMVTGATIQYQAAVEASETRRELATALEELDLQKAKVLRYEMIIADMMQGQWTPEMGILKEFEEEWYGTAIWTFRAVHQKPGTSYTDVGEVIDRAIETQQEELNVKEASR
jgi:hypothetical protein